MKSSKRKKFKSFHIEDLKRFEKTYEDYKAECDMCSSSNFIEIDSIQSIMLFNESDLENNFRKDFNFLNLKSSEVYSQEFSMKMQIIQLLLFIKIKIF